MELPLGQEECLHCHAVVDSVDTYKVNGHGPVCEGCTIVAQQDFCVGRTAQVSRHYEPLPRPSKKG